MSDDYSNRPTHLRVFSDGDQWFIDGADNQRNYTEACWSFDSFSEAVEALCDFVEKVSDVRWDWDTTRPHTSRHMSLHSATEHGCVE